MQEMSTIQNPLDGFYKDKSGSIHPNKGCIEPLQTRYKGNIKQYIGNKLLTREPNKKKSTNKKIESSEKIENDLTPEESLFVSYQGIRKSVYREIIDTILSKNPREFEKLVVQLLQRMGYGGEIKKLWTGNPILK